MLLIIIKLITGGYQINKTRVAFSWQMKNIRLDVRYYFTNRRTVKPYFVKATISLLSNYMDENYQAFYFDGFMNDKGTFIFWLTVKNTLVMHCKHIL